MGPALLNLLSAGLVAKTETVVVVVKLIILGVVTVAGWRFIDYSRLSVSEWPSIPAIVGAGMLIFVAYEGFELIANAGEDVKAPKKTLGRAYYLSIGIVVVLYILVAMVTVGNLSPADIAQFEDFALAKAAEPALGQLGFTLVAVSAVMATFSPINASLYDSARLSSSIAVEGELPAKLEMKVWKQPVGLLITAGGSLVLANTLDLTAISTIGQRWVSHRVCGRERCLPQALQHRQCQPGGCWCGCHWLSGRPDRFDREDGTRQPSKSPRSRRNEPSRPRNRVDLSAFDTRSPRPRTSPPSLTSRMQDRRSRGLSRRCSPTTARREPPWGRREWSEFRNGSGLGRNRYDRYRFQRCIRGRYVERQLDRS